MIPMCGCRHCAQIPGAFSPLPVTWLWGPQFFIYKMGLCLSAMVQQHLTLSKKEIDFPQEKRFTGDLHTQTMWLIGLWLVTDSR